MNREEAIRHLERTSIMVLGCCTASEYEEALGMAIEALKKQNTEREHET